jgi:hypothetical protein
MDCPGIESEPPWWERGIKLPELWHNQTMAKIKRPDVTGCDTNDDTVSRNVSVKEFHVLKSTDGK